MLKNKTLKIIVLIVLPILLVLGKLLNINNFFYYVLVFMAFGFLIRKTHRQGLLITLSYWILGAILIRNIDTVYISLVMLLLGNFISYLLQSTDNNKKKKHEVKKDISNKYKKLSLLFPCLLFVILEILFYVLNKDFYFNIHIISILFSLLLIYILYGFIYAISNKTSVTNIIMLFIMAFFFIVNQFKVFFTGEVISASELIMITEAGELIEIIKSELLNSLWYYRKLLIMIAIIIVLSIVYLRKINYKETSLRKRFIYLFSILIYVLLLIPFEGRDLVINKIVFNDSKITRASSINDHYGSYRMIGGLYLDYLDTIDYSETLENDEDLKRIFSSVSEETTKKVFKKPNIILMLTEAFWDITKQDSIKFSTDPLKEYHEIKKESIAIDILSPVFGGKSSNTEFELITGGSLSYFKSGTLAYFKYYQTDSSKNNPSIIKELKNNGYKTYVGIAETAKTYSVDKVYTKMDFDVKNEWYEKLGYTVNDEYLVGDVIKTLKNKDKDERVFYMTVSMDSHMPYQNKIYREYDFEIVNNELDKELSKITYNYTESIKRASLQLKRIYDYIKTTDEETIVIFMGDHLPILNSFNDDLYKHIDDFNTDNVLLNKYRKYNTEALIVSNYDIDYDDLTSLSPDLLLTTIINKMDIEISDYYKWLYSTRKELPMTNWYIAKDIKGNIYDINNLPVDLQKVHQTKMKVQKYLFR